MNTVARFMTRHPYWIRAGETVSAAEALMSAVNCHHLPVKDGARLAGVISDRDIRLVHRDLHRLKVQDICVEEPLSVDVDTSVTVAAAIMSEHRVNALLVTDRGQLAGIFTATDACRALASFAPEESDLAATAAVTE